MDSTSKLTDEDLSAIAVYLKDQPVTSTTEAAGDPDAGMMKSGGAIYTVRCAACHAPDGSGVNGLFPMLKGSALVQSLDPASILRLVLRGARSAATEPAPTAPAMPSFGWALTDFEVATVSTYIRNAWGNRAPPWIRRQSARRVVRWSSVPTDYDPGLTSSLRSEGTDARGAMREIPWAFARRALTMPTWHRSNIFPHL